MSGISKRLDLKVKEIRQRPRPMTAPTTAFTASDTFAEFRKQCHNPRTKSAWEHGVKARALGRPMIYVFSNSDYTRAEVSGFIYCDVLLGRGQRWKCGECGDLHGRAR